MTLNQLRFHELEETKRANRAKEAETNRSNLAKELENTRSNMATEGLKQQSITEDKRRNKVSESYALVQTISDAFVKGSQTLKNIASVHSDSIAALGEVIPG